MDLDLTSQEMIGQLGRHYGIEPFYYDGLGVERQVGIHHIQHALASMGVKVFSQEELEKSVNDITRHKWANIVDSVVVTYYAEIPFTVPLSLPLGDGKLDQVSLKIQIIDEKGICRRFVISGRSGTVCAEHRFQGQRYVKVNFPFSKKLPLGYFHFFVQATLSSGKAVQGQALLIVAPRKCFLPSSPKRPWGISLQLYGIRSPRNWGIGDFRDLGDIMRVARTRWGVATIGINPLHIPAAGLSSPYSPSSRLFWNPIYLNVEEIVEWQKSSVLRQKTNSDKFQHTITNLRTSPHVDYEAVGRVKWEIFEQLFQLFSRQHLRKKITTPRKQAFCRFVARNEPHLTHFCTFQALNEFFRTSAWQRWPKEFQHPQSKKIEEFRQSHAPRIQFFQYVQWLCELQLQKLDQLAKKYSLSLRLYHDLPVGIHPDGADAWIFQDQMASGISVGAPPDAFNLLGQNWGLGAPNPLRLREEGYQFLRKTFQQNMRHGGILRIDHALGLFRMFWIPEGGTGRDGLYVKTHVDEILAVLTLESVRRKVMVVGEDLGTVTPDIRKKLDGAGLLSYRLLLFERESGGGFLPPAAYPEQALVAATTHDLPTLKGFWMGRDIAIKQAADLYPRQEDHDQDWRLRREDRQWLWEALLKEKVCPADTPSLDNFSEDLLQAVYRFLARTPSRLLIVQLEDLLAELDTPNLPGAPDSAYPSWRIRSSRDLEAWLKDPALQRFAQIILRERGRGGRILRPRRKSAP